MTADQREAAVWERAVLHLDMDAFFVNVHLLDHPEDEGVPLAVGGRPEGRGVVASASYEARRFGVRSAMPAARALRLCPQIKFVGRDWSRIRACSREVMAILRDYGPVEQLSVDEAYVDVSDHGDPADLAQVIRERVQAETGLPTSVGLAQNKLVAKVASDHDKPEGCTVVRPGEEAGFLEALSVRVIWGIGPRTAERLALMGISTCGELAAADPVALELEFGDQGASLQRRARGEDSRPVEAERGPPKSISQERTFNEDVDDPVFLREKLQSMSEGVAVSLQKQGLIAHTVFVKFRWADFTTFTRQRTVEVGMDEAEAIAHQALTIWEEHWPPGQKVRLLGVGVSKLEEPVARQLDLFGRLDFEGSD
ncbi:MAG: DNA polymerase IV [Candidatus Promineifilaceae bacterium]|nr:DNA polymerase IV [Candidatus Promineifilaceae bacterium]